MLDDLDRRLLRLWQDDPELSASDLAGMLDSTPARIGRRIERLQASGIIRARRAMIDWPALGYHVSVSLRITLDKTQPHAFDEAIAAAEEIPEIVEIQTFLGRVDLRLSVVARDMPHYQSIWRERLLRLPHIAEIEGLMTVATLKNDARLPL